MTREEKRHLIETHVAGICFRETETDIEVLIAKRREDRNLFPGKWECGGGQVFAGENFQEAIKRQMEDELGVSIARVIVFGVYEISVEDLEQKKIPGVKFICFFDGYLNGQSPRINEKEFSQWKWQSINNLSEIDFIPGMQKEIRIAWEFYNQNKNILK